MSFFLLVQRLLAATAACGRVIRSLRFAQRERETRKWFLFHTIFSLAKRQGVSMVLLFN